MTTILRTVFAAAMACAAATSAMAQDKVTLVVSNSQWLDALRGEGLWNAVKAYEKTAPNIELKALGIPSKDYGDRLMTEFGAGAGPDVAIIQEGVFYARWPTPACWWMWARPPRAFRSTSPRTTASSTA